MDGCSRLAGRAWRPGLLIAAVCLSPPASAGQCKPLEDQACVLELAGEHASASASCAGEAWAGHLEFLTPERFADGNGDGWWETVLRLDLEPERGCSCARLRIDFGATSQIPLHVGNSPTNDGYGGDASTSRTDAELQIADGVLQIYSADAPPGSAFPHDRLDVALPPLDGRVARLEVCDQLLSFELEKAENDVEPVGIRLSTPATRSLLAVGGGGGSPGHSLYLAFNRVIHRVDGAPVKQRFGSGVRRVELFLQP